MHIRGYRALFAWAYALMHAQITYAHTVAALTIQGFDTLVSMLNFQDATPRWVPPLPLPSLTLSPVIHSCDWGWEWRQRSAEKWNREDPGRGLEWSTHHPPQKTFFKFFMAIFTSFNPKTLYISTFSHVAASSTSTPSSPSQSWLSGWHMLAGVGDGSKGDPQVDPPPSLPTHTYTNTHTHTHPQLQGFAINTNAGEGNGEGGGQGVQWWGG